MVNASQPLELGTCPPGLCTSVSLQVERLPWSTEAAQKKEKPRAFPGAQLPLLHGPQVSRSLGACALETHTAGTWLTWSRSPQAFLSL